MSPDASAFDIICVYSDHCSVNGRGHHYVGKKQEIRGPDSPGVKGPNIRGSRLDSMTPDASAFDISCVYSDHCPANGQDITESGKKNRNSMLNLPGVKRPNVRGARL